jgi:hypothetical protein
VLHGNNACTALRYHGKELFQTPGMIRYDSRKLQLSAVGYHAFLYDLVDHAYIDVTAAEHAHGPLAGYIHLPAYSGSQCYGAGWFYYHLAAFQQQQYAFGNIIIRHRHHVIHITVDIIKR